MSHKYDKFYRLLLAQRAAELTTAACASELGLTTTLRKLNEISELTARISSDVLTKIEAAEIVKQMETAQPVIDAERTLELQKLQALSAVQQLSAAEQANPAHWSHACKHEAARQAAEAMGMPAPIIHHNIHALAHDLVVADMLAHSTTPSSPAPDTGSDQS